MFFYCLISLIMRMSFSGSETKTKETSPAGVHCAKCRRSLARLCQLSLHAAIHKRFKALFICSRTSRMSRAERYVYFYVISLRKEHHVAVAHPAFLVRNENRSVACPEYMRGSPAASHTQAISLIRYVLGALDSLHLLFQSHSNCSFYLQCALRMLPFAAIDFSYEFHSIYVHESRDRVRVSEKKLVYPWTQSLCCHPTK